jgi:hypothetical protein
LQARKAIKGLIYRGKKEQNKRKLALVVGKLLSFKGLGNVSIRRQGEQLSQTFTESKERRIIG